MFIKLANLNVVMPYFKDVDLLFELIDEKDAQTKELKQSVKALQQCCNEVQSNLEEAQMIISEQQEQLDIYRQEVAISKTNIEALKVRKLCGRGE